jgi:hypothetical protein
MNLLKRFGPDKNWLSAVSLSLAVLAFTIPIPELANAGEPKMIAFFLTQPTSTGARCPDGWVDYPPLKGRFVFATTDPAGLRPAGQPPFTVGKKPFDPAQQLSKLYTGHSHQIAGATLIWDPVSLSAGGASIAFVSAGTAVELSPLTGLTSKDKNRLDINANLKQQSIDFLKQTMIDINFTLPVYELKACIQDTAADVTRALPFNTLAFFSGQECPRGDENNQWEKYENLSDRMVVALPDAETRQAVAGNPKPVGYGGEHIHNEIEKPITIGVRGAKPDGFWGRLFGRKTDFFPGTITMKTGRVSSDYKLVKQKGDLNDRKTPVTYIQSIDDLLPNVHLMPCYKKKGKVSSTAFNNLYENYRKITILSLAQHCSDDWETVPGTAGRFLMGLRDGKQPMSYGQPLHKAKPINIHEHQVGFSLRWDKTTTFHPYSPLPTKDSPPTKDPPPALADGRKAHLTTSESDSIPPYMMLRHCWPK